MVPAALSDQDQPVISFPAILAINCIQCVAYHDWLADVKLVEPKIYILRCLALFTPYADFHTCLVVYLDYRMPLTHLLMCCNLQCYPTALPVQWTRFLFANNI